MYTTDTLRLIYRARKLCKRQTWGAIGGDAPSASLDPWRRRREALTCLSLPGFRGRKDMELELRHMRERQKGIRAPRLDTSSTCCQAIKSVVPSLVHFPRFPRYQAAPSLTGPQLCDYLALLACLSTSTAIYRVQGGIFLPITAATSTTPISANAHITWKKYPSQDKSSAMTQSQPAHYPFLDKAIN